MSPRSCKENVETLFEFLGLVIGKAIFEGIAPQLHLNACLGSSDLRILLLCASHGSRIVIGQVVEPSFAPFFLAKILGKHNSYYDLQSLDPAAKQQRATGGPGQREGE